MNIFTSRTEAAEAIATMIGSTGEASATEYDMDAIADAAIQTFAVSPIDVRFYVAAAPVAASDIYELGDALDEDAYDIAESLWAIVEANAKGA